jgi:hypothetical protein
MMWVRLIGGLHDGEVVRVDADQVETVMRKTTPPPSTRAFNSAYSIAEMTVDVMATRYTRRSVRCSGDEVVYFAPEALSDLESLRHALGA